MLVARVSVVLIGSTATALALWASRINVSFAAGLAFAVAASAVLPALLYGLYWRGFTTTGAVWSIYGGLICSVTLAVFSPAVSGTPTALLPDMDFAVFPLKYPSIVSIPLALVLGWLGSVLSRERSHPAARFAFERRMLVGSDAS